MRRALTKTELLVVIALIGVLFAVTATAVQRVRTTAQRTAAQNALRQLSLGGQHFVTTKGKLPHTEDSSGGGDVMPYLARYMDGNVRSLIDIHRVQEKLFHSPTDPSLTRIGKNPGTCSFAVNSLASQKSIVRDDPPDGLSATLFLSERYATCADGGTHWSLQRTKCIDQGRRVPCDPNAAKRRATFSDAGYTDIQPVRQPDGKWSVPDTTFQLTPPVDGCDARSVQSSTPGGLLTAFADGSVHTLSPSVAPAVFWGLVTPDGGEVAGDW